MTTTSQDAAKLAQDTQTAVREFVGKHGSEDTATFLLIEADRAITALRTALFAPAALAADGVPTDWLLRSKVADLLHLLDFSSITTATGSDDEQARRVMLSIKGLLAAPAAKAAPPNLVVDALVAAGFVSREKADEAARIMAPFAAQAAPAARDAFTTRDGYYIGPAAQAAPAAVVGDAAMRAGLDAFSAPSPTLQDRAANAIRAALAASQPAPVPVPAEPLTGWKLNHVRHGEEEGTAEIGYMDPEDDRFSPIVTVDTGLYFQPGQAKPLAVAILGALQDAGAAAPTAPVVQQPVPSSPCRLGCTTECKAREHGCASECPALPWQPPAAPVPAAPVVQQPIGYMSAKQVSHIVDPDGEFGTYIPMRKTPGGLFTLALYAAPQPQAPKE